MKTTSVPTTYPFNNPGFLQAKLWADICETLEDAVEKANLVAVNKNYVKFNLKQLQNGWLVSVQWAEKTFQTE